MRLGAFMLLLGVLRHVGYTAAPIEHQARVWNILGSLVIGALVIHAWMEHKGKLPWLIATWWLYEEALVATCSTLRLFQTWPVPPGGEQCSTLIGVKLGSISLVAIGWMAAVLLEKLKNSSPGKQTK